MARSPSNTSGQPGTTENQSKKARRRTGAVKRARQRVIGSVKPVDELGVRTAEDARAFFLECGRNALASGTVLRVTPQEDADAFTSVEVLCRHNQQALGKRLLPAHYVAGAGMIANRLEQQLGPVPDLSEQPEAATKRKRVAAEGDSGAFVDPPQDAEVIAAHSFVTRRRRAIARMAKGPKYAALRKAFGIDKTTNTKQPTTVIEAIKALLTGRSARRGSVFADLISTEDVRQAKSFLVALTGLRRQGGAARSAKSKRAKDLTVLQAGLEVFYDRYSAACELAFEDDEVQRVEALALVPRREVRHAPPKKKEGGSPSQPGPQPPPTGSAGGAAQA